ncbi:acetate--CoA ligase family protein [Nonomuraea sp. NPDC059194]|uniref:acetate--CoA ligase family protein n=1 Tax=Nonomuraea sp. NPDC059194 TaxID=3346764 RepID=UPI00369D35FB
MWTEHRVKELLRQAGVPVPRGVADPALAGTLTPPLVLKSAGLLHKSDAGGVRLGLTHDTLGPAVAEMRARLGDGFLVEEQAPAGVELIVGLVRDPAFGPVLLAGLGGVWTEALRDTALRLCPITETDARRMLASLRGSPLLYGYRGSPPVDVDAVVKLLLTIGGRGGLWERLELGEFELNPVIASPSGVVAVDARYLPSASPTPVPPTAQDITAQNFTPQDITPQDITPQDITPQDITEQDFTALFEPRRVAVVGASTSRPNFGNMFLDFYLAAGADVVAVHPSAASVGGVPAVPSLSAADADYALVAVPATRCADVVRQARGVPYTQVMSGGFGEAGHPELEAALVAAAREAGTRLLGPNCMGVYCPAGRQTFVGGGLGPPGTVALISQSGGLAGEVIKVGERRGLAFSRVATVGNAADVTPAELLRWLSADPSTSVVGLYVEDPRDGPALFSALAGCPLPVVLLVGGRSGQGRRAAASHTGGMVSDSRIWQALADQTGATLVTTQDALIGTLAYFQAHAHRLPTRRPSEDPGPRALRPPEDPSPRPRKNPSPATARRPSEGPGPRPAKDPGPRRPTKNPSPTTARHTLENGSHQEDLGPAGVLVVGPSGGAGVLAADAFDDAGLTLDPLPDDVLDDLRALGLGVGSSLTNPLEVPVGPRGRPDLVKQVIATVVGRLPYQDVVAHVNVQSFFTYGTTADPLLDYARHLAQVDGVRVTLVTRNGEFAPPGVEDRIRAIAAEAGIPVYRSMEAAAIAVAAGQRFRGGTDGTA